MEMRIRFEGLGKVLPNKTYPLEVRDAHRAQRNRSRPNLSDCCGTVLKEEKHCAGCNGVVVGKTQRKLVKIGKQEYQVSAEALEQVKELLESGELVMHTVLPLDCLSKDVADRTDSVVWGFPAAEKGAEGKYAELVAVLQGKAAVGKGVFRTNEFEVVVTVGDDNVVRIQKLVEQSQMNELRPVELVACSTEVVELTRKVLGKEEKDAYDFSQFRDRRVELEEKVIEEFVLNGKVPEVRKQQVEQQELDEVAQLKAALGE